MNRFNAINKHLGQFYRTILMRQMVGIKEIPLFKIRILILKILLTLPP